MRILFTGGGTAGHIFPIIAIAREIRKNYPNDKIELFYIGPDDEFRNLLSNEGIIVKTILAGKIRRFITPQSILLNFIDIFFKFPISFLQAFFYIFIFSPDLIFSKGGYGSFPVVFNGWLYLTPIFLHESDAIPGLANRLASNFCIEIFISFPMEKMKFPVKKMISIGNPIRKEILNGEKEKAKEYFGLSFEKPIILILGGSQGSQRINDKVLTVLPELLENFEVIHQTGSKNFKQIQNEAKITVSPNFLKYYHISPFLSEEELKHAFAVTDLVCSRAGAGSIFEISAVGKPSILIPLPESAQNHQVRNAYAYAKSGACLVIEETNLTPNFFIERIKYLFSQPEKLEKMSECAKAFSKPNAAEIIAKYIIDYLTQ